MSAAAVFELGTGGAALQLWPQRAAFDPESGSLLIADAHIGKAQSFRRLGVPVPSGTTAEGLARLDRLLEATGARRIVFLGDLLHAKRGLAPGVLAELRAWRERHGAIEMTLVRGNHDERAGDPPPALGIACVDGPVRVGPWAFQHHPEPVPGAYALAGHVHPCVVLSGRANDRLRLPCFHFGARVGVLPAFGGFTGMHALPRAPEDRLFAISEDRVVPLQPRASSSASSTS